MNRKAVVSERTVYHKFVKIEVEVPFYIKDSEVGEWLSDSRNEGWASQLVEAYANVEFEYGSGINDYTGMGEEGVSCETRYDVLKDVKEIEVEFTQVFGGHL
jgi:hypothetical protein